jgi:hypothetical protein
LMNGGRYTLAFGEEGEVAHIRVGVRVGLGMREGAQAQSRWNVGA